MKSITMLSMALLILGVTTKVYAQTGSFGGHGAPLSTPATYSASTSGDNETISVFGANGTNGGNGGNGGGSGGDGGAGGDGGVSVPPTPSG